MKVKVWNKNVHPFTATFNAEKIHIPAGEFILMEAEDAQLFKYDYHSPVYDGGGQQDPRSYKMIEIEGPAPKLIETHKCNACGKSYESVRMLEVHIDENHIDELADKDLADKRRGRHKKEEAA